MKVDQLGVEYTSSRSGFDAGRAHQALFDRGGTDRRQRHERGGHGSCALYHGDDQYVLGARYIPAQRHPSRYWSPEAWPLALPQWDRISGRRRPRRDCSSRSSGSAATASRRPRLGTACVRPPAAATAPSNGSATAAIDCAGNAVPRRGDCVPCGSHHRHGPRNGSVDAGSGRVRTPNQGLRSTAWLQGARPS